MSPQALRETCDTLVKLMKAYNIPGPYRITFAHTKSWKAPKGWPRGELMCETATGKVKSYPIAGVLKWLDAQSV